MPGVALRVWFFDILNGEGPRECIVWDEFNAIVFDEERRGDVEVFDGYVCLSFTMLLLARLAVGGVQEVANIAAQPDTEARHGGCLLCSVRNSLRLSKNLGLSTSLINHNPNSCYPRMSGEMRIPSPPPMSLFPHPKMREGSLKPWAFHSFYTSLPQAPLSRRSRILGAKSSCCVSPSTPVIHTEPLA